MGTFLDVWRVGVNDIFVNVMDGTGRGGVLLMLVDFEQNGSLIAVERVTL